MVNMAVSGSVGYDLLLQVRKFTEALKVKPDTQVAYVTILIGANDTCDAISPDETYSELTQALDLLASVPQKNTIKILVSSLPQIHELGQPEIRNHPTGTFGLSCEVIRSQMLKFCDRLTHWSNDAEFQADLREVQNMNAALAKATTNANLNHKNLEVKFSEALFQKAMDFNVLASDCFHPNISGQSMISEILWNDQPWFK